MVQVAGRCMRNAGSVAERASPYAALLTAFTPSQFTRNSLIVVNQEEKKNDLTTH